MQTRLVTALFETGAEARLAADDVVAAGIDRDAVSVAQQAAETGPYAGSLNELLLPEADHHAYAEGLRRGGALVAVRIEDARVDLVARVLEDAGAVDLDARERDWRDAGWAAGAAASGSPDEALRLQTWRAAGHGTGRVRSYTSAGEDDDERTTGDPKADSMGLNASHPARHGGL